MSKIILFNKPYGVLSQFTDSDGHSGLSGYIAEKDFYPAGRLDRDSEGLLLLTDDGGLQARISSPRFKLPKTYLVQVEGLVELQQLQQLSAGVELKDGLTQPAQVREIEAPQLWERIPPVRFRKSVPTSWLELKIREGKNRQVRRMTAAVGLPTLRLVRWAIGDWTLANLQPGEYRLEEILLPPQNSRPSQQPQTRKPVRRHAR
ncbi:MAG: pseudouridine synthase [Porticoccaceae bacterium]|nr:pseudouridine synthase [Porticoccaceae bacterium]